MRGACRGLTADTRRAECEARPGAGGAAASDGRSLCIGLKAPRDHGENAGTEHYGMGLYICKMLCEKQGGFLQVYNPPGGGACVEFYIVA